LFLAGCGTTFVSPLSYTPSAVSPSGKPVLAVQVVDGRGQDVAWIGTAEGDVATPTRQLATPNRVVDEVDQAFVGAMLGRGLLAPVGGQRFDVSVRIVRLDGSQRLGFSGRADFAVTVARHDTGRVVYQDEVAASADGGAVPSFDTLAFVPTGDVALATSRAMSDAIDAALDKPAFRAAIAG